MRLPVQKNALQSPMSTQQGAVLITGLLILLVLTILGITSMSGSSLQERMAGNDRDRQIAFQAAEAALRHAENYLGSAATSLVAANFTDDCESGLNGHCNPKPSTTEQWLVSANWTNANKHRTYAMSGEILTDPKYIIEYIGKQIIPPATAPCATCNDIYRITALGTGATNTSRVMLQSIYVRTP